jgi:hypothetical protein
MLTGHAPDLRVLCSGIGGEVSRFLRSPSFLRLDGDGPPGLSRGRENL